MPTVDFSAHYAVDGYEGIAFYLIDFDMQTIFYYDNDLECYVTDDVTDTQHVIAVMVGDDREHTVSVDDLILFSDDAYCAGCGQIGCGHGKLGASRELFWQITTNMQLSDIQP